MLLTVLLVQAHQPLYLLRHWFCKVSDLLLGSLTTINSSYSVLVHVCTTEVNLVLNGYIYGNNSIVTVDDIAENDSALLCYTNSDGCCESSRKGEWYFPSGTTVGVMNDGGDLYRNRGPSVVRLNRRNNAMMPTGVFRCEIPDVNGTNQSIYVGIYPHGEGTPVINNSLSYSYNQTQSLECTSIGGPATNVKWWKNDVLLDDQYDQYKIVINETSSEYQNILSLYQKSPEEVIGSYICLVRNTRGERNRTIQLNGEDGGHQCCNSGACMYCHNII